MDEAIAGINPKDIDAMVKFIRRIRDEEKIAIVSMVEHIVRAVSGLAERVMVMHQGQIKAQGTSDEIRGSSDITEAYLGI